MEQKLTKREALNAMRKFLDGYYERTFPDDIASLLGDITFLADGSTADPAVWKDWEDSINIILKNPEKKENEGLMRLQK